MNTTQESWHRICENETPKGLKVNFVIFFWFLFYSFCSQNMYKLVMLLIRKDVWKIYGTHVVGILLNSSLLCAIYLNNAVETWKWMMLVNEMNYYTFKMWLSTRRKLLKKLWFMGWGKNGRILVFTCFAISRFK